MVDTREGDGDHFERIGAGDDLGRVGVVGDHDDLGALAASSELGRISCFGIEIDKLVSGVLKGCGELVDSLLGYSQRFDQGNLHLVTPQ